MYVGRSNNRPVHFNLVLHTLWNILASLVRSAKQHYLILYAIQTRVSQDHIYTYINIQVNTSLIYLFTWPAVLQIVTLMLYMMWSTHMSDNVQDRATKSADHSIVTRTAVVIHA